MNLIELKNKLQYNSDKLKEFKKWIEIYDSDNQYGAAWQAIRQIDYKIEEFQRILINMDDDRDLFEQANKLQNIEEQLKNAQSERDVIFNFLDTQDELDYLCKTLADGKCSQKDVIEYLSKGAVVNKIIETAKNIKDNPALQDNRNETRKMTCNKIVEFYQCLDKNLNAKNNENAQPIPEFVQNEDQNEKIDLKDSISSCEELRQKAAYKTDSKMQMQLDQIGSLVDRISDAFAGNDIDANLLSQISYQLNDINLVAVKNLDEGEKEEIISQIQAKVVEEEQVLEQFQRNFNDKLIGRLSSMVKESESLKLPKSLYDSRNTFLGEIWQVVSERNAQIPLSNEQAEQLKSIYDKVYSSQDAEAQ